MPYYDLCGPIFALQFRGMMWCFYYVYRFSCFIIQKLRACTSCKVTHKQLLLLLASWCDGSCI
jgi:hypothetical protein